MFIYPVIGVHRSMPADYSRVIRELELLGLVPTGNEQIDRAKLANAKEKRAEKFKIEEEKEEKKEEELLAKEKLEEERLGATALAELNRVLLGI